MLTTSARHYHIHELISFVARQIDEFFHMILRQRGLHAHVARHINHVDTLHPPALVRETRDFIVITWRDRQPMLLHMHTGRARHVCTAPTVPTTPPASLLT